MGLLTHDNEAGRGGGKAYIEVVKSFGIETTNIEFWPVGTTDFYPYLTRLMAQEPDLIDISSSPVEEGLQAKQLRELGYEGYVRGLCNSPEVTIETAGGPEAVEGLYCIYAVDWDGGPPLITEQMARFRDEYRADYPGDEPGTQSLYVYDAAVGLLEAMKVAGTVEDTTKVRDALRESELGAVDRLHEFLGRKGDLRTGPPPGPSASHHPVAERQGGCRRYADRRCSLTTP